MVTELWGVQEFLGKKGKNIIKTNQRDMTQKLRKGEQPLLYAAHSLALIHIPINFHEDIRISYRVMGYTRIKITQIYIKTIKGSLIIWKNGSFRNRENLQY